MLNKLSIDRVYETLVSNVAEDFYIPCLSNSIVYKRVAGYFSSASLAHFSLGLEKLYENNGRYKLIISNEISKEDYDLLKQGYELKNSYRNQIEKLKNDFQKLNPNQKMLFNNLAYLISIGFVEIKVGFTHTGLFHSKYGIFRDLDGNRVYFSGSNNETEAAFIKNYESFTVIESWNSKKDALMIEKQEMNFDKLWNNEFDNSIIFVKKFDELLESTITTFSKGKLIMDSAFLEEDALVLFYKNNKLQIADNLNEKRNWESIRAISKIKSYLIDEKLWNFKNNLNYREVGDIIHHLERAGQRLNANFIVSDSVYDFIDSQKFAIEDTSRMGLLLKNKDKSIESRFNNFKNILNNEVERPLHDIQMWVSFYMATMKRVGNFSVPGSGKTAMIYGTFAYLNSKEINEIDNIVMIGPKNSFKSWKDEFYNVFGSKKEKKVLDIHSPDFREEMLTKHLSNYNLFLFNYEAIQKHQKVLESLITNRTLLVFDEVHRIKGLDSVRAQAAIEIAQNAKYRYLLTGTPIPNGYQDVWNIIQLMYREEYRQYFHITKAELGNLSHEAMLNFNERFFPFYWRVTKKELGVPKANPDNLISISMTANEQQVIDLLWKKYRHNPFVLYARLIQFSSNPQLLKRNLMRSLFINDIDEAEGELLTFEYSEEMFDQPSFTSSELELIDSIKESSKFKKTVKYAMQLVSEKKVIIIWCIFVDTMIKLQKVLEEKGLRVALIYGQVSAHERERMITEFQSEQYDVLITNPHTLGESVSLHKVSHDALYLEYSFNLTHMLQSKDRIHRLGLEDSDETNYYYFVLEGNDEYRNTIDRKIYKRLKEKEDIMLEAIEDTHIGPEVYIDEKDEIKKLIEESLDKQNN